MHRIAFFFLFCIESLCFHDGKTVNFVSSCAFFRTFVNELICNLNVSSFEARKRWEKNEVKKNYMQFLSFRQHICQSLSIDFYQQLEILCSWCISIVAKVATNFHPPGQTKIHLCTHNSDSFFKEKKVFNCAHFLLFIA